MRPAGPHSRTALRSVAVSHPPTRHSLAFTAAQPTSRRNHRAQTFITSFTTLHLPLTTSATLRQANTPQRRALTSRQPQPQPTVLSTSPSARASPTTPATSASPHTLSPPSQPPEQPNPPPTPPFIPTAALSYGFCTSPVNTGNPGYVWDYLTSPSAPTAASMAPPPPPPASDEDYAAFLEGRSSELNDAQAAGKSGSSKRGASFFTAAATDGDAAAVPQKLKTAVEGKLYVSDSDEAFEAVARALPAGKKQLSAATVAAIAGKTDAGDVEMEEKGRWDPKGEYADVLDAVEEVTSGGVKVWRVEGQGSRCEYWILGVDEKGEMALGVRVGAVES